MSRKQITNFLHICLSAGNFINEFYKGVAGSDINLGRKRGERMSRQALKCEALQCIYNRNYNCSARAIEIKGGRTENKDDTFCETFTRYQDAANEIAFMYSVSGETNLYNMGTNKLPGVYCSAVECKYNEDQYCQVPSLKIGGLNAVLAEDTKCESFELRDAQQS